MAIYFAVDGSQRVVFTRALGMLTRRELLAYQRLVWPAPQVRGFDELTDLTELLSIEYSGESDIRDVAREAVGTDPVNRRSRVALVAPSPFADELARRYREVRMSIPGSNREIQVFAERRGALAWLGVREPDGSRA